MSKPHQKSNLGLTMRSVPADYFPRAKNKSLRKFYEFLMSKSHQNFTMDLTMMSVPADYFSRVKNETP